MLLHYSSTYQSEMGQQREPEGENRLGWNKYHEESDKQINCDKRPREERTGSQYRKKEHKGNTVFKTIWSRLLFQNILLLLKA